MDSIYKGILKKWNEDKGFGFISPENGNKDVFIHISALKKMSRRPIVGDVVFYQIHTDNDGKNRAVNVKIEGVATIKPRVKRKNTARSNSKLFPFVVVILVGLFVYNLNSSNELTKENRLSVVVSSPVIFTPVTPVNYKCDGREHCSQMNSRDEAKFFIRNCPNTKMDGDNDGIPCENDSRF